MDKIIVEITGKNTTEMAVYMRYHTIRKYPITQIKKYKPAKEQEPDRYLDITLGAAAGLLALVFAEGLFWGYMLRKMRK